METPDLDPAARAMCDRIAFSITNLGAAMKIAQEDPDSPLAQVARDAAMLEAERTLIASMEFTC